MIRLWLIGVLSDEAWEWLKPLLPDRTPTGVRWCDHQQVIEAIAWKYRTGVHPSSSDLKEEHGEQADQQGQQG